MATRDFSLPEDFKRALANDLYRAIREEQPYTVIVCGPRHLPGEDVSDLLEVAAHVMHDHLRDIDLAGRASDQFLAAGLPGTSPDGARTLAFRLKSDLALRAAHLRSTAWEAGFACLPDDGSTAKELLDAATENASARHLVRV